MSSSTEIWRHLPLLFQRSCLTFGRTCTVIEQLKSTSSNQKLTSLRLVGVEGRVDVDALSEALMLNSTLQQVSICGTFLQTVAVSPGGEHGIVQLCRAIGSLVALRHLTLQGNEDSEAFPVEALTLLVDTNNRLPQGGLLEDISCQYVNLLVSRPSSMTDLGQALCNCKGLKKVKLLSMDIVTTENNGPATVINLDPMIAALGHCEELEVGLRHRRGGCDISPAALQSLLAASGRLQKLTLKRRIPLDARHLSAILQCLTQDSVLRELQLDEVNLQGHASSLWRDLAGALQSNTSLQILDLKFAGSPEAYMDHNDVMAITRSLQVNKSLKNLCLLGALGKYDDRAWLDLVENHNFTLEEMELFPLTMENDYSREKLQFFLQLNRQQVRFGEGSLGLRTILREHNGSIPQELIQACVEAARQLGSEETDTDLDDDATDENQWEAHSSSLAESSTLGLSGLFYLLQQQPSLVLSLQHRMTVWETAVAKRLEEERKAETEQSEAQSKAYIPLGGASPQLLLLDDDIVALW